MSLNDYFKNNIFDPLNLSSISMHPGPRMKSALAYMNQRRADGTLAHRDHLLHRPLITGLKQNDFFHSGGAGCFAKPQDYTRKLHICDNRSEVTKLNRNLGDPPQQWCIAKDRSTLA